MHEPRVLFETAQLLVVHKPCGLVVERDPHGYASVEEWAFRYLSGKTRKPPFVGIVHRLDRPVSGVLLIAKKKSALKALNRQFEVRSVEKTYLAVVEKAPEKPQGELKHWIVKDPKNKRAHIVQEGAKDASPAQLTYKLLETRPDGTALLEVHPLTGKYHQIRVQLAAIGCPIIGDEKYGATRAYHPDCIALQAWKLKFRDPVTEEEIEVKGEE